MKTSELISCNLKNEIIQFAQSLVRIKSFSGQEGEAIQFIKKKMLALGYDEVSIDAMGNVIGRIGYGKKTIMFDSHIDTVAVNDEEKWEVPLSAGTLWMDVCMAEIIQRVEKTKLESMLKGELRGTLVVSKISSTSASLNAVPSECEVYLDRRMIPGETKEDIIQEMDKIIEGKNAAWEIGVLTRSSWTGLEVKYVPFHLAWKIDLHHELSKASLAAFEETFGGKPEKYDFWDFSTNAVTPVSMGIPTIGFGPGEHKLAHMRNENCEVNQIIDACAFYTRIIKHI